MSERQRRTLRDDVKKSANKVFQKWKKKPNKSVHVKASTAGAAITMRPGAAGPSGLISQTHHDQGSSSVSKSTQEKTNYSRLCRLLISIGSRVLRDTFDNIIPPENLQEYLKRDPAHSRLQLLRKKGVLTSVRWSKLYPATPTEVSSASFDIALLIVLLRTICNLSPPPAGWDTPPLTADTSRESDIARIKYFMNAVSRHAAEGAFSDLEFNSYWQQIRDILMRLGGADYGVVIYEMKDQDIEFLDGEHFRELLKQWKKVEDDIKEKLNEMETEEASKEEDPGAASSESITIGSGVAGPSGLTKRTDHDQAWNVFPSLQNLRNDADQGSNKTNRPSDLRTMAASKGFAVIDNQANGNCLFYALSEQLRSLKGIQISHKELRKTLVQFLVENPNLHDGTPLLNFVSEYSSWLEYLQSMAKDGTWGDHLVLFAAANYFQTPIRIISSLNREIGVQPDHAVCDTNPLVLGHIHDLHYVSLQPRRVHVETSTAGAAITTRPGAAWPSGLISQTHHDQGPEQGEVRGASGLSSVVSPDSCTSEQAHHDQAGSSSVLKSTQEELNYSRLCRLLISIGSRVLRDTFDSIIPPENLRELLKRDPVHSRLQLLRKEGVLTSVHWNRLYPATPTEVSSASFDISLLIVLLRTICNLSPPPAGWDTPPLTADTSSESDIARIKYFVNVVSTHAAEGSVSDAVFSSYWRHIRDTLVRLGAADYEDVIDEMKDQDIEFLDEEHFRELLKQWKKVEDDIKEKLNELETVEASKEKGQRLPYPTDVVEKIRQLYRTREQRLLPVPWLDEFSFHINDIFTRLKILGKEKTQGVLTDDITNMTAIFKAHAECQRPRTVLIEGDPGMGKTTYCQKLAYDWATKQNDWDPCFPEIEVLLLLKCHEIKSNIWKAIDDQILPEEMDTQAKECFFKFIRENQSKVLLVLDGLDEAPIRKLKMFSNLIESKELSGCYIVFTSRHEAGRNARRYCDILWEIVGFTQKDAESFIHKYFKNVNKEHLARKLVKTLWSRSFESGQPNDLRDLTKNPLNTALLCVIWEDLKGVFPTSRTELYIEIVLFVLRRYEQKQGLPSENEDLLSVYNKDLIYLGRMALESLQNGELCFEEDELCRRCIVLSKIGFLLLQPAVSKRGVRRTRYAFLHKSFQEFFSGFFLACRLIKGQISCESVVTDQRYESELYQVFVFLIGILVSKSKKTAESLVKSVAANINFTSHRLDKDAAKDLSKRVLFSLSSLSEHASLLQALGRHLNFTQLNLRGDQIGKSGAASLSRALAVNSSLTNLNLRENDIGDSGAASLSKLLRDNSFLTNLNLRWNHIGDVGAVSLSPALVVNTSLTNLDLSRNRIYDSGSSIFLALKVNSSLTNLNLSGNDIGDSGAASLSQALAVNSSLTKLDLSENSIGDSGAASLSQALAVNSSLTNLDLSESNIGDSGVASLCQALVGNSSLTNLYLKRNSIGDSGAASLSQALAVNSSLTNLDLSESNIGDSGVASLSQALAVNSSLTNLYLKGNSIGASGAASLSQALAVNSSLTKLDLSWNSIGDSGATYLSQALAVNSSLTELNLRENVIGDSGAAELSSVCNVNTTTELFW